MICRVYGHAIWEAVVDDVRVCVCIIYILLEKAKQSFAIILSQQLTNHARISVPISSTEDVMRERDDALANASFLCNINYYCAAP